MDNNLYCQNSIRLKSRVLKYINYGFAHLQIVFLKSFKFNSVSNSIYENLFLPVMTCDLE